MMTWLIYYWKIPSLSLCTVKMTRNIDFYGFEIACNLYRHTESIAAFAENLSSNTYWGGKKREKKNLIWNNKAHSSDVPKREMEERDSGFLLHFFDLGSEAGSRLLSYVCQDVSGAVWALVNRVVFIWIQKIWKIKLRSNAANLSSEITQSV